MCEWAGPNAVWYARHKRPGQRLVVRLHMFELRGGWLSALETDADYLWYFDCDGDGDVDGRDNGQFNRRFGK